MALAAKPTFFAAVVMDVYKQHEEIKRLMGFSREAHVEVKQLEAPLELLAEVLQDVQANATHRALLFAPFSALVTMLTHVVRVLSILKFRAAADPPFAELELLSQLCMHLSLLLLHVCDSLSPQVSCLQEVAESVAGCGTSMPE